MYFYDTCSLLDDLKSAFNEHFLLTNVTFEELEGIKTSKSKDDETKAHARQLLHLLKEKRDSYSLVLYTKEMSDALDKNIFADNNDSKVIAAALHARKIYPDLVFKTYDLSCAVLAESAGLVVDMERPREEPYLGYKKISFETEDETSNFYSNMDEYTKDLVENQYLLICVKNKIIDKYKYKNEKLISINYPCFDSNQLGKIKPKDDYQFIAMDCLKSNQLSLLRGPAGTGKSYLAMGYLFDQLERGTIEKIIVFCNTVATLGSAKLGYYPGSKDEKLLDSQIGNFLESKLGGREEVERQIEHGKIVLLPMSDIRGYDTTGAKAGIYITEAQNLDIELMRLALQRIGEDSICIIEGDDNAQVDSALYAGSRNGIKRVSEVFRGESFFGEVTLKTIHRSKIAAVAQKM